MIELDRYDPRKDKEELKELFEDFTENKSYFAVSWKKFEKELNKRALDLQYRNSMIVAKEGEKIVGWGTYTLFRDYLGKERVLIHQVLTKKQDSFKKGIEEIIVREIEKYLKSTLNLDKVFYICPDKDVSARSLLLKLGLKKSQHIWYEKDL
ncbi:MAG: GNAT family N-acetyltransferase [Promethearchaeota archaeon]